MNWIKRLIQKMEQRRVKKLDIKRAKELDDFIKNDEGFGSVLKDH